jgi:hypothetical protein
LAEAEWAGRGVAGAGEGFWRAGAWPRAEWTGRREAGAGEGFSGLGAWLRPDGA